MVPPSQGGCLLLIALLTRQCVCLLPSPSRAHRGMRTLPMIATSQPQQQRRAGGAIVANSPELGGDIIRIHSGPDTEENAGGYLNAVGVPTFAVIDAPSSSLTSSSSLSLLRVAGIRPRRMGLEGILHNTNAFILENGISVEACDSIVHTCEDELGFGSYDAGKNNHGAMQIVISKGVADDLFRIIGPHVDMDGVIAADIELRDNHHDVGTKRSYALIGINRRLRVYRYAPDSNERFAPHIDAGFPPGGTSLDDNFDTKNGTVFTPYLHWDASHQYPTSSSEVVSRLTVLIYLNDDFTGGQTKFYEPVSERRGGIDDGSVIASVKPRAGSILVFPQAVSESAVERARTLWPLHEGSPVTSSTNGRHKYVIRTDILFETIANNESESLSNEENVLFQHDDAVRDVFLNASPMFSSTFLHHVWPLYNPHMGVENAGPLLYSLVRFTKVRNVVEVGAGYTTLYLLQALKDNDDEMRRVVNLNTEGKLRLLDYPFGSSRLDEWTSSASSSSLLCIDNCEHQRETASSVVHVARALDLDRYLQFLKGDAFDALETQFSQEMIDMIWCDFGVGARMAEYISKVWRNIRPGGFLVCHSTLTNARTRTWLEGVRQRAGVDVTGIPEEEYAELSLLEPHKQFQNSMTILQKRARFEEPIYSEYA